MMDFTIRLTGTEALLMHNSRLSNPLDPAKKALNRVTSKQRKTDDDYAEAARLEFLGGLYLDPDVGPYLPGDNVWRALYDGAKKRKMGPRVKEGVFIRSQVNPLSYKGPRDVEGLVADESFRFIASAKVSGVRVMRCRPIFRDWTVEAEGILDPEVLDFADLQAVAEIAGQLIGIGDWRPRYGRFVAEVKAA